MRIHTLRDFRRERTERHYNVAKHRRPEVGRTKKLAPSNGKKTVKCESSAGDFLHGTINVKIPVFTIRRHGGTFFHGRGEFRVSELCLLSADDMKSHGS